MVILLSSLVSSHSDASIIGFLTLFTGTIPSSTPSIALQDAISTAEKALNGLLFNHPASLEYLARPDGSAALVHVFQIRNDSQDSWYEAFVDAHSGELLSVTDFVAHAEVRFYQFLLSFSGVTEMVQYT